MSCEVILEVVEEIFELLEVSQKGDPGKDGTPVAHNDLLNIQGGTVTERYHLTAAELGRIVTVDQKAALDGANAPSGANPVATVDDLPTIPDHNDLSGLQGGSLLDRYHLLLSERNDLQSLIELFIREEINLLTANSLRSTGRTVWGFASDAVYTDDQVLLDLNIGEVAITGGRRATTVDDGATIGVDTVVDGGFDNGATDWPSSGTWVFDSGVAHALVTSSYLQQSQVTEAGKTYLVTYTILNYVAGTINYRDTGSVNGSVNSGNGTYSEVIKAGGSFRLLPSAADFDIDNVSVKEVVPTWYATDINGVALDTSMSVEDSTTNHLLWSRDPDNAVWSQRGTFDAVQDLTGADGVANSGWTFSGLDTAANDISQALTALNHPSVRHEPSIVLKQISATGILSLAKTGGDPTSTGLWSIDLSKLSNTWETVDRDHEAVTVDIEFSTGTGSGNIGFRLVKQSGTGTLSVGFFNAQLEEGTVSTSQIYTEAAAATRDADVNDTATPSIWGDTWALEGTFTPSETGQTAVEFSSYTDVNNYVALMINPSDFTLRKRVGGVNYDALFSYTHEVAKKSRYRIYGGATGTGIAVADASADISAVSFITDADTSLTVFAATCGWGHLDGGDIFAVEIDNFGEPIAYKSKETAGW